MKHNDGDWVDSFCNESDRPTGDEENKETLFNLQRKAKPIYIIRATIRRFAFVLNAE